MKRSSIIAGIAAAIVGGQAVYLAAAGKGELLRPPGAQSESDFMARCVKCGKCLESCPYRAVHVAPGNAGAAAGTPVIDAREQACRLCEDFPCVAACPTGALRDVEARADVHMGTAVIEEDLCIALQGMRCEVCYRVCPLIDEAMTIDYRMREGDAIHAVFAPRIDREECVGCGLCVERCVVGEPRVAIRIVADPDQVQAALDRKGAPA